jgi:hypothetical protein
MRAIEKRFSEDFKALGHGMHNMVSLNATVRGGSRQYTSRRDNEVRQAITTNILYNSIHKPRFPPKLYSSPAITNHPSPRNGDVAV